MCDLTSEEIALFIYFAYQNERRNRLEALRRGEVPKDAGASLIHAVCLDEVQDTHDEFTLSTRT